MEKDELTIEKNPIISIIVAVYNQEDLVAKCIESVLNQTFQNLELILINDGSKDNSKEIIDQYARLDNRIKAIHQSNVGLAEVRNIGIQNARGQYIGFVDGDDWVNHDMYERLYNACIEYDSDMSACFYDTYDENYELVCSEDEDTNEVKVYKGEEAIRLTYEHRFTSFNVWNKLFHRKIFTEIMFPSFRAYEDEAILAITYSLANKIAVVQAPLYNHMHRNSGIQRSILNKFSKRKMDILPNYMELYNYLEKHHPNVCELVTLKHFRYCMDILMYIVKDEEDLKENYKYVKELSEHIQLINERFRRNKYLTRKEKAITSILATTPFFGLSYYKLNYKIRLNNKLVNRGI